MDSSYNKGPTPTPYADLVNMRKQDLMASNDSSLAGLDYEYTRLVFGTMLGATVQYYALPRFTELYVALRNESCHVAVTAAEMDPTRTLCTSSCPPHNGDPFVLGDYVDGGYDEATLAQQCCLEYGVPYLSQGFALLSLLQLAPFDVISAVFNADVGNAALVILLISGAAGFIMWVVERNNPDMGSFSRASYWSIMTFFLLPESFPSTKPGRFIQLVFLAANVLSMSIITSIVSAKLTTSSFVVQKVETLADVTSGLCMENNYPVAQAFVDRSPNKPSAVLHADLDVCIAMMLNGTVQAVLSDMPILNWLVSNYGLAGTYVSPNLYSNPFSFVYSSTNNVSSLLRLYSNPAVIATLTDDNWISKFNKIKTKYISAGASAALVSQVPKINMLFFKPCVAIICAVLFNAILVGEIGPGLPKRFRVTRVVRKILSAPPVEEETPPSEKPPKGDDGALVGVATEDAGASMSPDGLPYAVRVADKLPAGDDAAAGRHAEPWHSAVNGNGGHPHPGMTMAGTELSKKQVQDLLATVLAPVLSELREVRKEMNSAKEEIKSVKEDMRWVKEQQVRRRDAIAAMVAGSAAPPAT